MNQATLALDAPPAAALDRGAFDIGWDHARHGLVPPPHELQAHTPVGRGWLAGRAVFGPRTAPVPRSTRFWLQLRLQAGREGIDFDLAGVTPAFLDRIQVATCPVLRLPLGGATGADSAPVVERLDRNTGYTTHNLVLMSQCASNARTGADLATVLRRAGAADRSGEPIEGLDASAWWRLASLLACAKPLPFAQAARLPLALLLPPGLVPRNAAQRLQLLLTRQFTQAGWSGRLGAVAATLPETASRHDFNLLVGALAARLIEAGPDALAQRRALEDAWLHERVLRRWQAFAFNLGEAGVEALLHHQGTRLALPLHAAPATPHARAQPRLAAVPGGFPAPHRVPIPRSPAATRAAA